MATTGPTDPNWLLSTSAQSAAALVAIVGGFLVSRLVALSTQREGLRRRQGELQGLRKIADEELTTKNEELRARALPRFIDVALDDFVEKQGDITDDDAVIEYSVLGSTEADVRGWAAELGRQVREAFAVAKRDLARGKVTAADLEKAVDTTFWPGVLKAVAKAISASRPTRNPMGFDMPDIAMIRSPVQVQTDADWRDAAAPGDARPDRRARRVGGTDPRLRRRALGGP